MKRIRTYSLWTVLCLCIIYISATMMSTSLYCPEKTTEQEEILISDASSLAHLEEIISENLFTVPSPFTETGAKPTTPLLLKARLSVEKCALPNDIKLPAKAQSNISVSKSEHISAQFGCSAQYYVFALRHIII